MPVFKKCNPICSKTVLKKLAIVLDPRNFKYKCDACGKACRKPSELKDHIKTVHEGQKNHKCEFCEKYFSQKGHLKTHIECVHEGIKAHKCELCNKSFSQRGDLKKHVNTHWSR